MRTTLTIDDDLAGILHRKAAEQGRSFKEVVNATLRSGLAVQAEIASCKPAPAVLPREFGFRAGIDLEKLNQLADELETEEFVRKYSKQ